MDWHYVYEITDIVPTPVGVNLTGQTISIAR